MLRIPPRRDGLPLNLWRVPWGPEPVRGDGGVGVSAAAPYSPVTGITGTIAAVAITFVSSAGALSTTGAWPE